MISVKANNFEETIEYAKKLGSSLRGGEVIAYFGGLGMGKTTFTSGLCEGYGINAEVSSPTFALVNEYGNKDKKIYHFDMYRISGFEDLCSTGFFDYLDTNAVLAIEWSENIENALPENYIRLEIERGDSDESRIFKLSGDKIYEDSWR
ncbi:MAG: tRNA (adenosine(37)-N6)-threonylcarbamoyltransferase complex ATPase subunit type 1 TsaE [Clostridia bacterium]|nr:tRNA (adenosine(37)-N6)-threonylcarbamoyltransferase complex ATPase subunit type 1 TsaE [Clostridia bacterium]MBR3810230.1 tRNA (adenosine(37)-N6)-threonylcarbamoyltransferase complex ATPase subunit type 1 TsaE [Clostridia bacterium]